jgi:hypothetical protein
MTVSCTLAQVSPIVTTNAPTRFSVTVTNTNATAVTLISLNIAEATESEAMIGQPNFLTPGMAIGLGNPAIPSGGSVTYVFQAVFNSPQPSGPSSSNPGGAAPSVPGPDPLFVLQANGNTSDGTVFTTSLLVPVLTSVAYNPPSLVGAAQWQQGSNLITGLCTGLV